MKAFRILVVAAAYSWLGELALPVSRHPGD